MSVEYAVVRTNTAYHPRGAGPAYGTQFNRLSTAWSKLRDYGNGKVNWVINGDVELDMWLYRETKQKDSHTVGVFVLDDIRQSCFSPLDDDSFPGLVLNKDDKKWCTVFGPGEVSSEDELIQVWWSVYGQFNPHPWDPNGIVMARRLGLKRGTFWEGLTGFIWSDLSSFSREDLEETDRLVFAAFDRGEFEKKHQREIWNENNKLGFNWNEASLA